MWMRTIWAKLWRTTCNQEQTIERKNVIYFDFFSLIDVTFDNFCQIDPECSCSVLSHGRLISYLILFLILLSSSTALYWPIIAGFFFVTQTARKKSRKHEHMWCILRYFHLYAVLKTYVIRFFADLKIFLTFPLCGFRILYEVKVYTFDSSWALWYTTEASNYWITI